ncbi:LysR family transcriptional regulator [Roseovarius phycicola]
MYVSYIRMNNTGLPPLTWLRAFEAAARHLSFTLAAQELNLTQSAVSQHVRSLEAFLGRELFIRRTRALQLTEAGANYLPTLREAFDLLARGTRSFTGGDPGRTLLVQCNMAFSVFWLAPRLHRLYAAHPWLTLNISTAIWDPERTFHDAPVEIRLGRTGDMSQTALPLPPSTMYPVCAPDYQDDLIDLQTARLFDCSGMMGNWEYWCTATKTPFNMANTVNLASTYVVAMQAALHRAGICMSHDTLAADLVASGHLIRPFEGTAKLPEAYFLMAPARHDETPASRAFVDWLQSEFAKMHNNP